VRAKALGVDPEAFDRKPVSPGKAPALCPGRGALSPWPFGL